LYHTKEATGWRVKRPPVKRRKRRKELANFLTLTTVNYAHPNLRLLSDIFE
jgi:hypothetical protein